MSVHICSRCGFSFYRQEDLFTHVCAEDGIVNQQRIKELEAERDEARAWVRRLTEEHCTLTCVYCGVAYPPGTPAHGAEVLTAHIKVCPKHPMAEVEARLRVIEAEAKRLRDELQLLRVWVSEYLPTSYGAQTLQSAVCMRLDLICEKCQT